MNINSYIRHAIYIHDKHGNDLAKTTIIDYQPDYMIVTVKGMIQADTDSVTVLILENNGVHEYQGRIRRVNGASLSTEIALFRGKEKETRTSRRYTVSITAQVESLIYGERAAPLLHPMEIFVVNLSASGALLRAKQNAFLVDSVIGLRLPIDEISSLLRAKIMRVKPIDSASAEYGCKFI